MQANKNHNYQIKEKEKGFYHLKLVQEIPTADERQVIVDEKLQIFSVQGFKQFLANKKHFNFKSEEIIHDPTLMAQEKEPDVKPAATVPTVEAEQPAKKQPYFGSEKHKADLEAKKQLKNS